MESLFSEEELAKGLLCKAFSRHLYDGNIWQLKSTSGEVFWQEDFMCDWCMTRRITPLEKETAIVTGSRQYSYTPQYDRNLKNDYARTIVAQRIFKSSKKRKP